MGEWDKGPPWSLFYPLLFSAINPYLTYLSIIRMSSDVFITGLHRHDAPRGIVFAAQRQKKARQIRPHAANLRRSHMCAYELHSGRP